MYYHAVMQGAARHVAKFLSGSRTPQKGRNPTGGPAGAFKCTHHRPDEGCKGADLSLKLGSISLNMGLYCRNV